VADVHEWLDEATRCFGIEVVVTNRTWRAAPLLSRRESVPAHVRPVREERRE
jgi:hypothetical protein